MAKRSDKHTRGKTSKSEALQRKIGKAREQLLAAQQKRSQVMREGEEKVGRVRQQAARRLDAATARVERRSEGLAELEAKASQSQGAAGQNPRVRSTPETATQRLAELQGSDDAEDQSIVLPESAGKGAVIDSDTPR